MKSSIFSTIFYLAISVTLISCSNKEIDYAAFDKAVSTRNTSALLKFAQSEQSELQEQAFRALHNTPIYTDSLLNMVLANPSKLGFFALAGQKLNPSQFKKLIAASKDLKRYQNDIYQVFAAQSDKESFDWLISNWASNPSSASEALVFAISKQALQHGIPDSLLENWVTEAISSTKETHFRAYLYGPYRSQSTIIKKPFDQLLVNYLLEHKQELSTLSKQYIVNSLARHASYDLLKWVNTLDFTKTDVTLQIEIGRGLRRYLFSDLHNSIALKFLQSDNELVLLTFFQNVSPSMAWDENVNIATKEVIRMYADPFHPVALAAQLFGYKAFKIDPIFSKPSIKFAYISNPYSISSVFEFSSLLFTTKEEIELIQEVWSQLKKPAFSTLSGRIASLSKKLSPKELESVKPFITQLIYEKDRAVLVSISEFLSDVNRAKLVDTNVLFEVLEGLDPIADIEVYQAFLPYMVKNTSQKAQAILMKLAETPYMPMGKSLRDAGYSGSIIEAPLDLATPNRTRLIELGKYPKWKISTNKGDILIELDAVRNPTTVWLIDSLSRTGKFNSVVFHRVVPNFVVQGGDFERGDGYGGSDTTIPTEGSELEYEREAVGMASAGTDTESAQYFIMHQWHPHLNGRYTRFGKVKSGMDVVDKLIVGDKVISSSISK